MFGYIKADKPEMKVKEYEAYKGLYCSVCKAMKKHYGLLSTLTLSYDITFLLLMRLSFSSKIPSYKKGRCPFNIAKKCNFCCDINDELCYCASVSMMLFYFKVKDNISDSSLFKRMLMYLVLPYAFIKYKKAKKLYPEIAEIIEANMNNQSAIEKNNTTLTDAAAHASADSLGKILSYKLNNENNLLYKFGYGIGKWVYLMDAFDDIEKDIESKSYNVFVLKHSLKSSDNLTDDIKDEIVATLNMSHAYSIEAWEQVKDKSLLPIAENILYNGIVVTMNDILERSR